MDIIKGEHDLAERTKRWLKAELKRADMTYETLAQKLREKGFEETRVSVANKLSRGTFPATFLIACVAVLELEGVRLEDL